MIASILFLLAGLFYLIAGLGLIRLPDPLARLHAGTKASSLATALALGAAFAHHGGWWSGLLALAALGFVFLTAPLASHAIARSLLASRLVPDADEVAPDQES
jgi:multicomponent Na+:H+ antiporter subunit G